MITDILYYPIQALSVEWPTSPAMLTHPNRVPFSGILTRLDEPSTRSPNGASKLKVVIPIDEASKSLPSLLGMGVNCGKPPNLAIHDAKKKIGIIDNAFINDKDLFVSGFLYAQDFPEEVNFIKNNKNMLGMSYEISRARVISQDNTKMVVGDFYFTGAAILWKNKAAYQDTSIAANAADTKNNSFIFFKKGRNMVKTKEQLAAERQALEAQLASLNAQEAAMPADEGDMSLEKMAGMMRDYSAMCKAMGTNTPFNMMGEYMSKMKAQEPAMDTPEEETQEMNQNDTMLKMMEMMLEKVGAMAASPAKEEEKKETKVEVKTEVKSEEKIDAAALMTDMQNKMTSLLTDMESRINANVVKLVTDMAQSSPNGGEVRKTMNANQAGEAFSFLSKLEGGLDKKWKTNELDEAIKNMGLNPEQRIAIKQNLAANGKLEV